VQLLLEAGASRDGVWLVDKPPSEAVARILRDHGVTPEEPPETVGRDQETPAPRPPTVPSSGTAARVGTGVTAEIAGHLQAAYRDEDLDLLGSLLHAEVTWAGCRTRAQVLDWYRGFQAEGTVATVTSVEFDRDAVVLELDVFRRAEGARSAPPRRVYQVFRVEGSEIVDIRFFPDRLGALGPA
jgi:hypothetical protein